MAVDEHKLIEDLARKSDGFKDYTTFLKLNAEFQLKKKQQKLIWGAGFLIVYLVFVLGFLSVFRNNTTLLLWPFKASNSEQISKLEARVDLLQAEILKFSTSSSPNPINDTRKLDARMDALEQTINLSPEKALTATLIREQQKNLEQNVSLLRDSQNRLESKVDNFVTTVLIAPIFAALLTLLGWFLKVHFFKKV